MRKELIPIVLSLCVSSAVGQIPWTAPVQIITGPGNDVHPSCTVTEGWITTSLDWLAFSREGDIYVAKTAPYAEHWVDSLYRISTDSSENDFPSMATTSHGYPGNGSYMLVWQSEGSRNLDIHYSIWDSSWSVPRVVSSDSLDERFPRVAALDSGFCATWERAGRIMYSEYRDSTWSLPEMVADAGDAKDLLPDVQFVRDLQGLPMVVWERTTNRDSSTIILASIRTETGWSVPDTLASRGNCRRPRFYKSRVYGAGVSWESDVNGTWQIYGREGYYSGTHFNWEPASRISQSGTDEHFGSVNGFNIITDRPAIDPLFFFTAATWLTAGRPEDSISVTIWGAWSVTHLAGVPSGDNGKPDISSGVWSSGGFRIWTVWANNIAGQWKLYGSSVLIPFFDVKEDAGLPTDVHLYQNYPNPFNPTTEIKYQISRMSHVSLKVFDVLGREVAVLLDEVMDAGEHSVQFDAGRLSTGVYYYELTSGDFTSTRKMLLIR